MEYYLNPYDYINVYHFILLFVLIFSLLKSFSSKPLEGINFLVNILFFTLIILIGFRPVSGAFGDMGTYAKHYTTFNSNVSFFEGFSDLFFIK